MSPTPLSALTPRYRGPDNAPKLMVVGDSVAFSLAEEGITPLADELGVQVVNHGISGCTILRDHGDRDGVVHNCSDEWQDRLERDRPDVVAIVMGVFVGGRPVPIDGRPTWPCQPAYQQRWEQRLDQAVDVLSSTGAEVVLLTAPYGLEGFKGDDPELFDARQTCSNATLVEVAERRPGVSLVDLAGHVCPTPTTCRATEGDVHLRADGIHFRQEGAELVARWVVPEVMQAASGRGGQPS